MQPLGKFIDLLGSLALSSQVLVYDEALTVAVKPVEVIHKHVLWPVLTPRAYIFRGNPVIRINED